MIFRESTETSGLSDRRIWAHCSLKILSCMPGKRFTWVGRRSYPILAFVDINLIHSLLVLCTTSPQLLKQNNAASNRFCFISCFKKKNKPDASTSGEHAILLLDIKEWQWWWEDCSEVWLCPTVHFVTLSNWVLSQQATDGNCNILAFVMKNTTLKAEGTQNREAST